MKYLLYITIIATGLLAAQSVSAGIIIRPVFHGGLVGYWDFQEGEGSKAYDKSGNLNHGTLTNMAENDWVDGKIGQGLDFDGSNDYFEIPYSATLNPANLTVCMWMKQTGLGDVTDWQVPLENQDWDAKKGYLYMIYPESGTTKIYWRVLGGGNSYNATSTVDTTVWNYYCGNFDGTTSILYINGQFAASKTANYTANNQDIVFGYDVGGSNAYFQGLIDEVRIYNRALSAEEIKRLYKLSGTKINTSQNSKITNGLVGLWSFNGPDIYWPSNTAIDRSGQGNHGTITNGPSITAGKVGQALEFNGSDDYVRLNSVPSIGTGDLSISAWVKRNAGLGERRGIIGGRSGGASTQAGWHFAFWDGTNANKLAAEIADGSHSVGIYAGTAITDSNWHHAVIVFDRDGNGTIYLDGSVDSAVFNPRDITAVTGNVDSSHIPVIGARDYGTLQWYFPGLIDEVRIYNRALTPHEIRRLYNMGR